MKPILLLIVLALTACRDDNLLSSVNEVWTIRSDEVELGASARVAGAVDRLTWKGVQLIDAYDHGRLQSAMHFDGKGECYNPTEAGSAADGTGPTRSSKLLAIEANGAVLKSRTQMAYWLPPGMTSPTCAKDSVAPSVLSDYVLSKVVTIKQNVVIHDVQFSLPRQQRHAVFEVLTAYLPAKIGSIWAYDLVSETLQPLSDGPGEQRHPIIMATADGAYALGMIGLPADGARGPHYGRWRFRAEQVVKSNCVFRKAVAEAGDHRFRCFPLSARSLTSRQASFAFPADRLIQSGQCAANVLVADGAGNPARPQRYCCNGRCSEDFSNFGGWGEACLGKLTSFEMGGNASERPEIAISCLFMMRKHVCNLLPDDRPAPERLPTSRKCFSLEDEGPEFGRRPAF